MIISTLIIAILLVFLLSGCGEVTYSVTIESGGSRTYCYEVKWDASDANINKEKAAVETLFNYYVERLSNAEVKSEDNRVTLTISYASLTEYYIANGITGDEPNDPSEPQSDGLYFQKYVTELNIADITDFASYALKYLEVAETSFADNYVRVAANSVYNDSLSRELAQKINRALQESDAYSALKRLITDGESYNQEAAVASYLWMKNLGYDFASVKAYFEYSIYLTNIEGVDPDEIKENSNGQKVYVWKLDPLDDNQFTITQWVPAVWAWELSAVLVGVLIALLLWYIVKKHAARHPVPVEEPPIDYELSDEQKQNLTKDLIDSGFIEGECLYVDGAETDSAPVEVVTQNGADNTDLGVSPQDSVTELSQGLTDDDDVSSNYQSEVRNFDDQDQKDN